MTKGSAYGLRRSSTEYNNNNAWNVNFNSGNRNANNKNNGNYVRPVLAFGIKLRVRIKRDYGRLERTCFEIKRVACNLLLTEKKATVNLWTGPLPRTQLKTRGTSISITETEVLPIRTTAITFVQF